MTIISTAKSEVTPLDLGEGSLDLFDEKKPSFPPVDDFVSYVKNIDWADVRKRARHGLNNVGLVVAVVGEKIHDFGSFLAEV